VVKLIALKRAVCSIFAKMENDQVRLGAL